MTRARWSDAQATSAGPGGSNPTPLAAVNGTGGDNYVLNGTATNGLLRYYGDIDGDGDVDGSDLFAYVPTVFNAGNYIAAFDFDGDGDVDGTDLFEFVQNLFVPLP